MDGAELLQAVDTLATRLLGHACQVLAVLADNGPDWVVADLAALRVGLVHLPLPGFFTSEQMVHALETSGADSVLTDDPARIAELGLGFAQIGTWNELVLLRRERGSAPVPLPTGTAKISFTSGSTGQPKGVCLSAAGLMDTALSVARALEDVPVRRHLCVLPLALLLENVAGTYAPLLRGAELYLSPLAELGWRGMSGFDPIALAARVADSRAGSVILVPELLKAWTQFLAMTGRRAPEHLQFVAVGGARSDAGLISCALAAGLPVYEGYGLTECGSVVSLNRPGADRPGSVGRPLPHVQVSLDRMGEIHVCSRAGLGYLNGPIFSDPDNADGNRWPTGDLGSQDADGFLHLSGRRKNLLITAYGRNVAPEWVEAALTAQPEIAQAVVGGDGQIWLTGILVPAPGIDADQLAWAVAKANTHLPDYARVGDWIRAAPFTPQNGQATGNGRPRREAITAHYAAAIADLYQTPVAPTGAHHAFL